MPEYARHTVSGSNEVKSISVNSDLRHTRITFQTDDAIDVKVSVKVVGDSDFTPVYLDPSSYIYQVDCLIEEVKVQHGGTFSAAIVQYD